MSNITDSENTQDCIKMILPRYSEDLDSLKLQTSTESDASWGIDRWVEEEKKRLWLGFFRIKV